MTQNYALPKVYRATLNAQRSTLNAQRSTLNAIILPFTYILFFRIIYFIAAGDP
jgi:hypothetical protein